MAVVAVTESEEGVCIQLAPKQLTVGHGLQECREHNVWSPGEHGAAAAAAIGESGEEVHPPGLQEAERAAGAGAGGDTEVAHGAAESLLFATAAGRLSAESGAGQKAGGGVERV